MRLRKVYFLLFILGLGAGVFFALNNARASNPQGEVSGGEQPASVYYDESWKASDALVSKDGGYQAVDISSRQDTPKAGQLEKVGDAWSVKVFPKMIVTKWKVHGHIHFQ